MNERADTLAGLGAQGVRMREGRPFDPPVALAKGFAIFFRYLGARAKPEISPEIWGRNAKDQVKQSFAKDSPFILISGRAMADLPVPHLATFWPPGSGRASVVGFFAAQMSVGS